MAYYGSEAAVEAVDEFITAATYGINAELATMRTVLSVTTANLPDVASVEKYYPKDLQSREFPHLSIVYRSDTAEQQANSRMINLSIDLRLTVLDLNVDGGEGEMGLAMCRYRDALTKIFLRRTPMGKQGWTLSNGGTGTAQGRVIRATIEQNQLAFDPEIQASTPNMMLRTSLLVRMQEDY